jgi:hypothetical protein
MTPMNPQGETLKLREDGIKKPDTEQSGYQIQILQLESLPGKTSLYE